MNAYRVSQDVTDAELATKARGLIAIERDANRLVLRWWWFSRLAFPWLIGAVLCGLFMWGQWNAADSFVANALTFPFLLCAVFAVSFGYIALAYLVNRTRIVVDDARIVVRHGPIPWPGSGATELARLRQLFVKREVYGSTAKSRTIEFRVRALTVDDDEIVLVNGPMFPNRARAIEATLEAFLHIENEPVKGEYGRDDG